MQHPCLSPWVNSIAWDFLSYHCPSPLAPSCHMMTILSILPRTPYVYRLNHSPSRHTPSYAIFVSHAHAYTCFFLAVLSSIILVMAHRASIDPDPGVNPICSFPMCGLIIFSRRGSHKRVNAFPIHAIRLIGRYESRSIFDPLPLYIGIGRLPWTIGWGSSPIPMLG